ncbi:MAG: carbohydrate kinase [Candidatus Omnitrophica bacterium]|nr:carbohydrate kinase [Candidatus Omnitrophota bacterium]
MKENNIICCGNIAFDLISSAPKEHGHCKIQARPGGSVLNTAVHLARLGLPVSIMAKTGTDRLSGILVDALKGSGVDTSLLVPDKKIRTGLAIASLDKNGNSSYIFYSPEGKDAAFTRGQLTGKPLNNAAAFHVASLYAYNDHTFENSLYLLEQSVKKGVFSTFDPNWRPHRVKDRNKAIRRIKKLIDIVSLPRMSESDIMAITGTRTLSKALRCIRPDTVVTLGEKGSLFWNGKRELYQRAFKVKVRDTIGAGDAFTAGLIYMHYINDNNSFWDNMRDNLEFASAVSGVVCLGTGATEALKSLRQVRLLMGRHGKKKTRP